MTNENKSIFAKRMLDAFENVACLGRDAYGNYINKMVKYAEIKRRETSKKKINDE
ncbi:MAG: hypothetical protein ACOC33_04100 [bacterium]